MVAVPGDRVGRYVCLGRDERDGGLLGEEGMAVNGEMGRLVGTGDVLVGAVSLDVWNLDF